MTLLAATDFARPTIRNAGRFVADVFLALPALRAEFGKANLASDVAIERAYKAFRQHWQRMVYSRITDSSTVQRTTADLHLPLLEILGFAQKPVRREVEIELERVALHAFPDTDRVLVDALPFARSADDRLGSGAFRGTAHRRMVAALAADRAQFGLILGGTRWRLMQLDTANEPRYVEFDLAAIIEGDDFAAFSVLATFVSPLGLLGDEPLVASIAAASDARGTDVSDALGPAARVALQRLLEAVRRDERNATWAAGVFVEGDSLRAIHREGIVVLYRLLFVLYGEAAIPPALPLDRPLYRDNYSLERIRARLADDIFREDSYGLWDGIRALFNLIDKGAQTDQFRIPAYNGGLFSNDRTPSLDRAAIDDRALAEFLRALTMVRIGKGKNVSLDRVSFRELGVAQLGAVFEGLLDYEPHISREDLYEAVTGSGKTKGVSYLPASALSKTVPNSPAVREGELYLQAWGGQRKSTGAYYTPRVIADYLVREALGPQISGKTSEQILRIAVCDPAMGSGGFLVSATEFLGEAYYRARVSEGTYDADDENADDDRIASKRIVAEHCIYGVDVNPMAVELAKVSLWLTTLSYDRPLSFFDHHLRCGNSLLGAPLRDPDGRLSSARLQAIPNDAFAPIDKDAAPAERDVLKARSKRNLAELRAAERGGMSMFTLDLVGPLNAYARARDLLSLDDPTQSAADAVALVRAKERRLRELTQEPTSAFFRLKEIADLWMSPWFWEHDSDVAPPTTDEYGTLIGHLWEDPTLLDERLSNVVRVSQNTAVRHRFFHWELEFPEVFERGGFDAIVGNPPWETLSTQTKEFFESYAPGFRTLSKQSAISAMRNLRSDRMIDAAFRQYSRRIQQLTNYVRRSNTFPILAVDGGKIDLFRVFCERDFAALRSGGSLAQVFPSALYVNATTAALRRELLVNGGRVDSLVVNENRKLVFPIDSRIKIALLVARRALKGESFSVAFFIGKDGDGFDRCYSSVELHAALSDVSDRLITLPIDFLARFTPETGSVLEVLNLKDVALLEHLSTTGIMFRDAWKPRYATELNMTTKSKWFNTRRQLESLGARPRDDRWLHPELGEFWPLIEGKHIYQFEFPVGEVKYWVSATRSNALPSTNGRPVNSYARLCWRNVARSSDERSTIATIVPASCFLAHSLQELAGGTENGPAIEVLQSVFNSFIFDWQMRLRGTLNATNTLTNDLIVPLRSKEIKTGGDRAEQDASILAALDVPFDLAEHLFLAFPLLDRRQPPLSNERRSTITRDAVLLAYARLLDHPRQHTFDERVKKASERGARAYIPTSRDVAEDDEEEI